MAEEGKQQTGSRETLDSIKLFADISSEDLAVLSKQCRWIEFVASDIILDREADSRDVYFLTRGKVRVMNFIGTEHGVTLAEMVSGSVSDPCSNTSPICEMIIELPPQCAITSLPTRLDATTAA